MDLQQLRQFLRARRRALSTAQHAIAATGLAKQIQQSACLANYQHIAVYWAVDGEINPCEIIHRLWQQQKNCYLPVLTDGRRDLHFAAYFAHSELAPNRFGIPEPRAVSELQRAEQMDAILLPLVAFDQTGNRLGMGGGFYDATLQKAQPRPFLLGLAYAFQSVPALTPKATDVRLDAVLTEEQFLFFHKNSEEENG